MQYPSVLAAVSGSNVPFSVENTIHFRLLHIAVRRESLSCKRHPLQERQRETERGRERQREIEALTKG